MFLIINMIFSLFLILFSLVTSPIDNKTFFFQCLFEITIETFILLYKFSIRPVEDLLEMALCNPCIHIACNQASSSYGCSYV